MIARKSDSLRAQEVLEAISETNERIKAFDITEDQFLHANDVRTRALADSLLMCALRVTKKRANCRNARSGFIPKLNGVELSA